jgi:hypothetical protein
VGVVPTFEPEIVSAVLAHMNGDHNTDNLLIARAFGDAAADSATMTSLDEVGGSWSYTIGEERFEVTVPWSGQISERAEIRREIVVLHTEANRRLGLETTSH